MTKNHPVRDDAAEIGGAEELVGKSTTPPEVRLRAAALERGRVRLEV
jgi:hypothetical protein